MTSRVEAIINVGQLVKIGQWSGNRAPQERADCSPERRYRGGTP